MDGRPLPTRPAAPALSHSTRRNENLQTQRSSHLFSIGRELLRASHCLCLNEPSLTSHALGPLPPDLHGVTGISAVYFSPGADLSDQFETRAAPAIRHPDPGGQHRLR